MKIDKIYFCYGLFFLLENVKIILICYFIENGLKMYEVNV